MMVDLLAKKMYHGDLLLHNFVLDRATETLHAIELDEGGIYEVPRRETLANIEGVSDDKNGSSLCGIRIFFGRVTEKCTRKFNLWPHFYRWFRQMC